MTPYKLLQALAAELREATKGFKFIAEAQEDKRVTVYEQSIPAEDFQQDTFYPLIAVEFLNAEDTNEISTASYLLTVGTYLGERDRGFLDLLNLVEEVRRYLLGHRIIGRQFTLELPLFCSMVEPISESYAFANIFVTYRIPRQMTIVPY